MRTSEEIQVAMEHTTRYPWANNNASVLADYIRELHERLREARKTFSPGIHEGEQLVLYRIDATLAKLPE